MIKIKDNMFPPTELSMENLIHIPNLSKYTSSTSLFTLNISYILK